MRPFPEGRWRKNLQGILTMSIFENIMQASNIDIREWEAATVPRAKFQTLTEQMYYILL